MGHRHGLITVVAAVALLACKQRPVPQLGDAAAPRSSADHLAPGEIAEGNEVAFGLRLPREAKVETRFDKAWHVDCGARPEELANYVRLRVKDGAITAGTTMTRFDNVLLKSDPTKHLSVEIRPAMPGRPYRSAMVVKDVTPPPWDPNISRDEAIKKAGLAPNGKPDPKTLQ